MKIIDFFSKEYYRESARRDMRFGIVDPMDRGSDETKKRAFTTTENEENWHASVENKSGKNLIFMPIDHNISFPPRTSLCDGMLYNRSEGLLVFIELKTRRKQWIPKAIKQLESTIELFSTNYDKEQYLNEFTDRRAYAANKKKKRQQVQAQVPMLQTMEKFHKKTQFILHIEYKIGIE